MNKPVVIAAVVVILFLLLLYINSSKAAPASSYPPVSTAPATSYVPAATPQHATICEVAGNAGQPAVSCSSGSVNVISATYGRHATDTCPYPGGTWAQQNTSCNMDVTSLASSKLNGKQSGTLLGTDVGTDPCVGTAKYFDIDYTCQ